ncbi:hypothetical protein EJV47_01330 [Hymenobacter gummosus]|uniref:histidine kinase n=1 Tax=Hymenobacter gummosus TaxID=1776032 RepID=A0A3S0HRE5_9BACT|nr:sensor histidine kinase [Hymenobacter gummosus]RTQ53411.1 hypothetical protein EJV47_01330 [Hymenobacter gummosus]
MVSILSMCLPAPGRAASLRRLRAGAWLWLGLLGLPNSVRGQPAPDTTAHPDHLAAPVTARQRQFFTLLGRGDSVYALKRGDQSLIGSLSYYTRAQQLAGTDTLLLAEAVFARGRVYDAWNQEPQQTVALFQQATDLFRRLPAQRLRYYYAWHLVAHAYDKVPDTLRTTAVLRAMRQALAQEPPAVRRQLPFTVELALIATQVGRYGLADSLLRELTRRAWIRNDPETYDYLTHYYLVQSRLDVYYRRRPASPYLDSLGRAYRRTRTAPERLYYSQNLAQLSAAARQPAQAYTYLDEYIRLADSLRGGTEVGRLRQALLHSAEAAEQQQHRAERTRTRTLWLLSGALAIITLLSFYLARQSRLARRQTRHLAAANQQLSTVNGRLDEQVAQVELLNKEIQHRVKNNLHILFSLLRMQERRTDSAEVVEQLQAARLRVESMAALHQQLMRQPGELPLAEFLRTLVSAVVACLANDRQVVTHLQTDPIDLPPDSYFPLSLMLNEWVTNSIKYADTQGQVLELRIRVGAHAHGTHLSYADNGQPAPAAAPGGLGTQIIGLLARQLRATLHTPAPYHYHLDIPTADGAS